ncbi:MAG: DUF4446 family protein [Ruminococcaceae bacterium]|nr:DUF4446 family protein [Oscillospiraceae bacterium]
MDLFGYFIDNTLILMAVGVFLGVIFLFTLAALIIALKTNKKMKRLLNDNKGTDILAAISDYYNKCREVETNFHEADERLKRLERESGAAIKKVGTLRYDAFDENNANLSFVAALLDESDSGFIINGVYSRGNTTTYLKSIREGKSIYALSDEEMQAIYIAKENYETKRKNNLR